MSEVDILLIDNEIQIAFQNERLKLPEYKRQIEQFELTSLISKLSHRTLSKIQEHLDILKKKVQDIESDESYNFYVMDTEQLLQSYREFLKKPLKVSFMGKQSQNTTERDDIVRLYREVVKKHGFTPQIETPKQTDKEIFKCTGCSSTNLEMIDSDIYVCTDCALQIEIYTQCSSYKDSDRVNVSTKYTYDRKIHFRDCINQFQGKQNTTINQKVYDDLEEQFEQHSLLVGDRDTPKEIRFSKVSRQHIYIFLKETEHTKHYEDVVLIHYTLTGQNPDDISRLENLLMEDFDTMTKLYDIKFSKGGKLDRKNFINTHYVLFQLLRRHGYPCKRDDFNILKTIDRQYLHDDICKELFEDLGWNFTPCF